MFWARSSSSSFLQLMPDHYPWLNTLIGLPVTSANSGIMEELSLNKEPKEFYKVIMNVTR